jgi:uncharacterized protein (DUF1800 family)
MRKIRTLSVVNPIHGAEIMSVLTPRSSPLTRSDAYHLLRRATYLASPERAAALVGKSPSEAFETLVSPPNDGTLPSWSSTAPTNDDFAVVASRWPELQRWWTGRIVADDGGLREKMTLFWHNVFTCDYITVYFPQFNVVQSRTIRSLALESYKELSRAMVGDPAMLVYLNGNQSIKGNPNENFAREWFELFSLGIGNYTEQDIVEAARAFTGWSISGLTGRHNPQLSDTSEKTILGRTGNWTWRDVVDITLEQPACARFLARKLWRTFVENDPDTQTIEAVAERIRASNYVMLPVLREIMTSEAFYDSRVRGALIKSPIELITGLMATFGAKDVARAQIVEGATRLEQQLYYPPTVEGWKGHHAWISSSTYPLRQRIGQSFIEARTADGRPIRTESNTDLSIDVMDFVRSFPGSATARGFVRDATAALLAIAISEEQENVLVEIVMRGLDENLYWNLEDPAMPGGIRNFLAAVVRMPEYQLL